MLLTRDADQIPHNLKKLYLIQEQQINLAKIPHELQNLVLGSYVNNYPFSSWPTNLKTLEMGHNLNGRIPPLPKSLEVLKMEHVYNYPLYLPDSMVYVKFGRDFNRHFSAWPKGITTIHFGKHYNQKLRDLPPHLAQIKFGCCFDHSIKNLPLTTRRLFLGQCFSKPLLLPPKLEELHLIRLNGNQNLSLVPNTLRVLYVPSFVHVSFQYATIPKLEMVYTYQEIESYFFLQAGFRNFGMVPLVGAKNFYHIGTQRIGKKYYDTNKVRTMLEWHIFNVR